MKYILTLFTFLFSASLIAYIPAHKLKNGRTSVSLVLCELSDEERDNLSELLVKSDGRHIPLKQMSNLELDICFNGMDCFLGALPRLKELRLNNVPQLPDNFFDQTPHLESLYIAEGCLSIVPRSLFTCIRLVNLIIINNNLTQLPEEVGNLLILKSLDLFGNNLERLPVAIGNCKHLERLVIGANDSLTNSDISYVLQQSMLPKLKSYDVEDAASEIPEDVNVSLQCKIKENNDRVCIADWDASSLLVYPTESGYNELDLSDTHIEDLTDLPRKEVYLLEEDCYNGYVKKQMRLIDIENLSLNISRTPVLSIDPLKDLPNLKRLRANSLFYDVSFDVFLQTGKFWNLSDIEVNNNDRAIRPMFDDLPALQKIFINDKRHFIKK